MAARLFAASALLLAAGLLAHAQEPTEFASPEGKYKVKFPGKPEVKESKSGSLTVTTATASPAPGQVYRVVYFDLPVDVAKDKAKETLKAFSSTIKGKLTFEKDDIPHGPNMLPMRMALYEMDKAYVQQYSILDGKRVYTLLIGAPTADDLTSKAAGAFFESFQITK